MEEDAKKNTQSEYGGFSNFPNVMSLCIKDGIEIKDEPDIKDEPLDEWDDDFGELNDTSDLKAEDTESAEEDFEYNDNSDLEDNEDARENSRGEQGAEKTHNQIKMSDKDIVNGFKFLTQSLEGMNTCANQNVSGATLGSLYLLYLYHHQQQQLASTTLNLQMNMYEKNKDGSQKSSVPLVNLPSSLSYESFILNWKAIFDGLFQSMRDSPLTPVVQTVNQESESPSSINAPINDFLRQSLTSHPFKKGDIFFKPDTSDLKRLLLQANFPKESSLNEDECSTRGLECYIDDKTLVSLSVRDFNRTIHAFPMSVQKQLKKRRRTLKNRAYANNCRARRQVYKKKLELVNAALKLKIQDFKTRLKKLNVTDIKHQHLQEAATPNVTLMPNGKFIVEKQKSRSTDSILQELEKDEEQQQHLQVTGAPNFTLTTNGNIVPDKRKSHSTDSLLREMLIGNQEPGFEYPPPYTSSKSLNGYSTVSSGRESASPEPLVINLNDEKTSKKVVTRSSDTSKENGTTIFTDTSCSHTGSSNDEVYTNDNRATSSDVYHMEDSEILHLSTTELNKRVKGWPKDLQNMIRKRRRTLKNRNYAKNCRQRRLIHREELEIVNAKLKRELDLYRAALSQLTSRDSDDECLSSVALVESKGNDRNREMVSLPNERESNDNVDEILTSVRKPFDVMADPLDLHDDSDVENINVFHDKVVTESKRKRLLSSDDSGSLNEMNNNNNNNNTFTDEEHPLNEGNGSRCARLQRKRKKILGLTPLGSHEDRTKREESLVKTAKEEPFLDDGISENADSNGELEFTGESRTSEGESDSVTKEDALSSHPSFRENWRHKSEGSEAGDSSSNENHWEEQEERTPNMKMKIDFFRKIKFKKRNSGSSKKNQVTLKWKKP